MEARGGKAGCVRGWGRGWGGRCCTGLGGGQAVGGNSVGIGNRMYTCTVPVPVLQVGGHSEDTLNLG